MDFHHGFNNSNEYFLYRINTEKKSFGLHCVRRVFRLAEIPLEVLCNDELDITTLEKFKKVLCIEYNFKKGLLPTKYVQSMFVCTIRSSKK